MITEATGLNFPENAFTEGENVVLNIDGSVERRLGIDFEDGFSTSTVTRSSSAISEYVWEAVAGTGTRTFVVVQVGSTLKFYNVTATGILSDDIKSFTVSLLDFDLATPTEAPCQYASGDGKLFVFHPLCTPFYVEYSSAGDTISTTAVTVKIRDFEGVEDSLRVDERPAVLSDAHEYNLYNQGWADAVYDTGGGGSGDAITVWDSSFTDFPSNADIWWVYLNGDREFDVTWINKIELGNTPAPKGRFILSAFNTDRSGAHANIGTVTETTAGTTRPRTGAFYTGRVWYAGVDAPGYNSNIYFSQIIEREEQIAFCYQQNDPTAEHQSDLLPSDGGMIKILEAGSIHKLMPFRDSLLIMATNGIWAVSGSEGTGGFKANDYTISKLSNIGIVNGTSVVAVESDVFFWNLTGIYTVTVNDQGAPTVQNLTDTTIRSYFESIPNQSKKWAKGAYNSLTKTVQWLYHSTAPATTEATLNYDRIMNLNLQLGAFFYYTVPNDSGTANPSLNGIVSVTNPLATTTNRRLFYYPATYNTSGTSYELSFAKEFDTTYVDWDDIPNGGSGTDFTSYLITGYKLYGQAIADFQNNYVTVYLNNDSDDSSLLVRGVWDFSTNTTSKRWSSEQQCYRWNDNHSVTSSRLKIRGRGKALQLKFTSEAGAPFYLIGWSIVVSGNAQP